MNLLRRIGGVFGSAIVISLGLILILGLLAGDGLGPLSTVVDAFAIDTLANLLLRLTTITIAVTIFIGIVNLLGVHTRRLVRRQGGWLNSIVLLASFLAGLLLYIISERQNTLLLEDVQIAVESALAGLLFFALVFGAYRMLYREVTLFGVLFVISILVVLAGSLALPGFELFDRIGQWWMALPVSAGARGILLGIALATIVTGVRVLLGQDRSYRE